MLFKPFVRYILAAAPVTFIVAAVKRAPIAHQSPVLVIIAACLRVEAMIAVFQPGIEHIAEWVVQTGGVVNFIVIFAV